MGNSQRQRDAWTQGRDQYQRTPWSATDTTTRHKRVTSFSTLFGLRRPGLSEDILAVISIAIILGCILWGDQISDFIDNEWIEHERQELKNEANNL